MSEASPPTKRDYYDVLGVAQGAGADDIKKAFRRKAKEYHPDTNASDEAEGMFKELGEAYDVLSDPQKRQVYDTYGHDGLRSGGYSPGWDSGEGFPDLGDLFSSIFGGGIGSRSRRGPRPGDDIHMEVTLDFKEACFGLKKEVTVRRLEHCETCHGSGAAVGSGPVACTGCGGNGQVRQTTQTIIGQFTQVVTCARCQGQGIMISDPCKPCNGKGRKAQEKSLTLTIQAGVDEGNRLLITQEGDAGPFGGPPGDLYIVVQVRPHELFERDGQTIYSQQKVGYAQLVLGEDIQVETLEGHEKLRIPPGTQSGQLFTVKNAGVPYLNNVNRRGDHKVQVMVEIPTKPTGEERKLIERMLELSRQRAAADPKASSGEDGLFPGLMHKMKDAFSGVH